MKKRVLFPCLLLVSSLTACGGSGGGLVTGGQPYREGAAQTVDSTVRAQIEDRVKTVSVSESFNTNSKYTYGGRSVNFKQKINCSMAIDLEEKTVRGHYDQYLNYGGPVLNENITFTGYENNGRLVIEADNDYSYALDEFYYASKKNIFSWDFSKYDNNLYTIIGFESLSSLAGDDLEPLLNNFLNNLVVAGDPSTGTFAVGAGHIFNFNYEGLNFSINKFKFSFKNYLLESEVFGLKISGNYTLDGQRVPINGNATGDIHYSYTFKNN